MRKKIIRVFLGIGITGVLLFFSFYQINFKLFISSIRQINVWYLSLCILSFGLSCFFRSIMWKITTRPLGNPGMVWLFGGIVSGYLVNNFLPLRAGEFYRAYYLSHNNNMPKSSVLATVFIERVLDVFSLGVLLIIGIVFGIKGLPKRQVYLILTILGVGLAVGLLIIFYLKRLIDRKIKVSFIPGRLLIIMNNFIGSLSLMRNPWNLILLVFLSLMAWGSNYLSYGFLIFNLNGWIKAAFLLLLFTNIGLLLPSSPGAIGIMQVAFWVALIQFNVLKEQSLALSFAYQAVIYSFTIFVGLPFIIYTHIKKRG